MKKPQYKQNIIVSYRIHRILLNIIIKFALTL